MTRFGLILGFANVSILSVYYHWYSASERTDAIKIMSLDVLKATKSSDLSWLPEKSFVKLFLYV